MKKIALSLFVIAASGAYVWHQSGRAAPDDLLAAPLASGDSLTGDVRPRVAAPAVIEPVLTVLPNAVGARGGIRPLPKGDGDAPQPATAAAVGVAVKESPEPFPTPPPVVVEAPPPNPPALAATPIDVPLPRLRPAFHTALLEAKVIPASMTVRTSTGGYVDGTYVGPVVDAYYGLIQIEATVQSGQLVSIRVLKYPSDRRTSVYINRQALPMLRDEVVSAQSANVDIISGATLTSEAFIRSLGGALKKARL